MPIEIDLNLLHLMYMLFDLEDYNFDNDIVKKIDELKLLIDKKLFKNNINFDFEKYNIFDNKVLIMMKEKK